MPAVRHGLDCTCCAPTAAAQSLDEVAFSRSACAAAQAGDYFRVKSLIQRNPAQLHSDGHQGTSGYTPLHYAARENQVDVIRLLLELGADPNRATAAGKATALHRAAYMGNLEVVRLLLDHGAQAQLQDADGQTAAHKAMQQGHAAVCQLLLERCPGLEAVVDARGRKAAELAPEAAGAARQPL